MLRRRVLGYDVGKFNEVNVVHAKAQDPKSEIFIDMFYAAFVSGLPEHYIESGLLMTSLEFVERKSHPGFRLHAGLCRVTLGGILWEST